jgi:hypothetical protein
MDGLRFPSQVHILNVWVLQQVKMSLSLPCDFSLWMETEFKVQNCVGDGV